MNDIVRKGTVWASMLVVLLAALAAPACAETGKISGKVSEYGGTIWGTEIPGDPMAGATVLVVGTNATATTDAQGRYELTVESGNYTVKASKAGFLDRIKNVEVEDNETSTLDFILRVPTGNVTGKVTDADDNTPIKMAVVSHEDGSLLPPSAYTDDNGTYTLKDLPTGNITLNVSATLGYTARNVSVVIEAGKTATLNVALKAFSYIVVTVQGPDGNGIPNATVKLGNKYSGTTDIHGYLTLEVAAGTYMLEVSAKGFGTKKQSITVAKGSMEAYSATLSKPSSGGGKGFLDGGPSLLLLACAVGLLAASRMWRKRS